MITPNFDNIDRWLFDYVEGNLSSEQESLLENYILNHPELEVDLDMWKMSNIKMSNSFVNDIQIQKKTENRGVFAVINTIGIIIILLIGRQIHLNDPLNSTSPILSENKIKNTKELSIDIQQHERINDNKSSIEKVVKSSGSDYLVTELLPSLDIKPKKSIGLMAQEIFEVSESFNVNDLLVERLFVNQDLELAKYKTDISIDEKSDLLSDVKESKSSESNSFSIKDKTKELINKIDRALSKNVALSNYRDHHYLIPQTSSIDANLSSIGSVSQTRFQSISRLRWMESDQRKLSQQITFDTYARGIRSGVGAQVNYDYYADGSIKDWNGALMLSPKIAISRNILLEPVAKLKIGNKLLDREKVENNSLAVFNSDSPQLFSYDSTQNVGRKLWYRDLDIGFTLNTNIFYIGAQASNILNHSENIYQNTESTNYRTPTVYSIFAGTQYVSRNEKLSFHPYFYMRSANKNNQYFGGFSLDLDKLYIGAAADFNDQYSGSIGLSLDRFALILQSTKSYIPTLNQHLYTHQLTIRINSDISKKTRRYITF
jgi:hypothetical protein